VLLDDALQNLRGAGVIPNALRVNHGDWALNTDPKAISLGSINQRVRTSQVELFKAPF
jgi:hypothetical protein